MNSLITERTYPPVNNHLLWAPMSYENLNILSSLTEQEARLLTELEVFAAAAAPAFQEAIFGRLLEHCLYISSLEHELGKSALHRWFIYLFKNATSLVNSASAPEHLRQAPFGGQFHRKAGIPVRYMLSLMELILQFGKRVTRNSVDPEKANSAFQKVLAIEFAMNQMYEDIHASHMAEMLLDD